MISMFVITMVLLIGIGMLSSLISERMKLRDSVEREIASSSVKSQQLVGPIIAIPYNTKIYYGAERKLQKNVDRVAYFLPSQLNITGDMTTEERYRGIYKANLYTFKGKLTGQFALPKDFGFAPSNDIEYEVGKPYIAVKVTDIRGIGNTTKMTMNDQTLTLSPLTEQGYLSEGVKSELSATKLRNGGTFDFVVDLEVMGTHQLDFVPAGKETTVTLKGAWPHPSFMGSALPKERSIEKGEFNSVWEVNQFSNITPEVLEKCLTNNNCSGQSITSFGVNLMDPVDHYRKSDRAVKYAILFIGLTFAGFFVFEVVRKMNIHPMQYALVGIALVLFFLLLISLSEHIGFLAAYIVASLACIALVTFYMHSALKEPKLSSGFAGLLLLLYITLYILLNGEEYSLLLGSILLFFAIGATMILTRNIDWYGISHSANVLKRKNMKKSLKWI